MADREQWLAQVTEDIIDPQRPIIDPHHHLWRDERPTPYLLPELWRDTSSGHNVVQTVFVECHAEYLTDGPEHLRPVGETSFVAQLAKQSESSEQATVAGIVAHADLRLGDKVDEVLDAHQEAADGRFRGIRHAGAHAPEAEGLMIPGRAPLGLYADAAFREGVKLLGRRGLSFDTWHYHFQNEEFRALAQSAPDTLMILDHFGTPLGQGVFAGKREEGFDKWKDDMSSLARCENVVAKLGGLAMPDNGFGWHRRELPPTSDEFVAAQGAYYHHMLECFGPDRCMFESNFPVDRWSLSYAVLYNGLKKLVGDYTESEKDTLFHGTAARVYRL